MLIRTSGPLHDDLYLLTLGASTRYLLNSPDGAVALFDPGASVHLPLLIERLQKLRLRPEQISLIFITHLHADRIGAALHLKRIYPHIQIVGTAQLQSALASHLKEIVLEDEVLSALVPAQRHSGIEPAGSLRIDRVVVEGDAVQISPDVAVRVLAAPGHTAESLAYLIEPHRFLITDEVIGYYRGKNLPAPGVDDCYETGMQTLGEFLNLDLAGLCLPYSGVLTGELVPKHIGQMRQTIEDIFTESKKARTDGIAMEEIKAQIRSGLYSAETPDPFLLRALNHSLEALWSQIQRSVDPHA